MSRRSSLLHTGLVRPVFLAFCLVALILLQMSCQNPSRHFCQSEDFSRSPGNLSDGTLKQSRSFEALPVCVELACASDGTITVAGEVLRGRQVEQLAAVASTNMGNVYELDMTVDAHLTWGRLTPVIRTFSDRGVRRMALIFNMGQRVVKVPVFVVSGTPATSGGWLPPVSAIAFQLTSKGVVRDNAVLSASEIGVVAASTFESVVVISAEPTVPMSRMAVVLETICRNRTISVCLDLESGHSAANSKPTCYRSNCHRTRFPN